MNLQWLINLLVGQLITLLPEDWRTAILDKVGGIIINWTKQKLDQLLDLVEEAVTNSENKFDDNLLPLCLAIRDILNIPEFDVEVKEGVVTPGTLAKVEVYPKPFENVKSELFVITNEKAKREIPGMIFFGSYQDDTYYIKKK